MSSGCEDSSAVFVASRRWLEISISYDAEKEVCTEKWTKNQIEERRNLKKKQRFRGCSALRDAETKIRGGTLKRRARFVVAVAVRVRVTFF
jgi:hypothetical protein